MLANVIIIIIIVDKQSLSLHRISGFLDSMEQEKKSYLAF